MTPIDPADPFPLSADHAIDVAQSVVRAEAEALAALDEALAGPMRSAFLEAAGLMHTAQGRVIVSGMGKSGHIARKIAATLASTGRPAQFVHPAEASHGDLGMITPADCVLALSRSGETRELDDLVYHCQRQSIPLIGMTLRAGSALARAARVALVLPDCGEASEDAPAPTSSTTMCLALGDALAVTLLRAKGFTAEHFSVFHPGGTLGAMLTRVSEVMRAEASALLVSPELPVPQLLTAISEGGLGCVGVAEGGRLIGVVTDGDLRRKLTAASFSDVTEALMTRAPKTVAPDATLAEALAIMNGLKITALFVVDAGGAPLGVVHLHDVLSAGAR